MVNCKDGHAVFTKQNGEIFKGMFKNDRIQKETDINFEDKASLDSKYSISTPSKPGTQRKPSKKKSKKKK